MSVHYRSLKNIFLEKAFSVIKEDECESEFYKKEADREIKRATSSDWMFLAVGLILSFFIPFLFLLTFVLLVILIYREATPKKVPGKEYSMSLTLKNSTFFFKGSATSTLKALSDYCKSNSLLFEVIDE